MAAVTNVTPELMANGFENTMCTIPGTISPGQKGIKLFWKYKELKKDDVVAVYPGCGCTAEVKILDDGIEAVYNDNHSTAPKTGSIFSKILNVSLNDGLPTHVPSDKGGSKFNDKKALVTLTFTGKVVGNQ